MTVTITHLFDNYSQAGDVVQDLESAGLTKDQISVVGLRAENGAGRETGEGAATGATLGGVAGAGAGLLASLGLVAIPGIGPLVAAGVIATTLAGAATGAVTGGVLGALVEYGISEEDAPVYAESIRRGGLLISVRADDAKADEAESIMQRHGPIDIKARRKAYRAEGGKTHGEDAPVYTETGRQEERERHGTVR